MSVPITIMAGSDNVGLSRLTINTNFAALKAASDAVTALLNPTTLVLSGIKAVTIADSGLGLSASILNVANGASILGNVILGSTASSVRFRGAGGISIEELGNNLTIAQADLDMQSATSLADFGGHLNLDGELRLPGVSTAFASQVGLTSTDTTSVPVSALKYMVITNGATSAAATYGLTASLQAGSAGQVLELYHAQGASGPVRISTTNFYGLTGAVVLTQTGDRLKCIYNGSSWYLWDFTQGATSSIAITRI